MHIDTDRDQRILVSVIISLAHALRLEVVAEGVETHVQQAILRGLGCDQVQGYLHSRPLPFDEMTAFLMAWPSGGNAVDAA